MNDNLRELLTAANKMFQKVYPNITLGYTLDGLHNNIIFARIDGVDVELYKVTELDRMCGIHNQKLYDTLITRYLEFKQLKRKAYMDHILNR